MHPRVTSYTGQPKKDHLTLQGLPRRGSAASIPANISSLAAIPPPPPRKESKQRKSAAIAGCILSHILSKQHDICRILSISRCFHLWRRETILLVESMKTRSERTTALMLGGVDEDSLDHMEVTRSKSAKMGISLMKWMLNSKHTRTLRRAWTIWRQSVSIIYINVTPDLHNSLPPLFSVQVAMDRSVDMEMTSLHRTNKELREKLTELKQKFKAKEELIRNGIVRGQMSNLMRTKMKASVRRRFDRCAAL